MEEYKKTFHRRFIINQTRIPWHFPIWICLNQHLCKDVIAFVPHLQFPQIKIKCFVDGCSGIVGLDFSGVYIVRMKVSYSWVTITVKCISKDGLIIFFKISENKSFSNLENLSPTFVFRNVNSNTGTSSYAARNIGHNSINIYAKYTSKVCKSRR